MKIPSHVHKHIKQLLPTLPVLPSINSEGKVMTYTQRRRVRGDKLDPETKIAEGKPIDPKQYYFVEQQVPCMVNHEVGLMEAFRIDGLQGIDSYVEWCTKTDAELRKIAAEPAAEQPEEGATP